MFCTKCGRELRTTDKFCSECGAATEHGYGVPRGGAVPMSRPLQRKIGGVCAGFARSLGIDVTLARIIAVILLVWPVPLIGGLAYLIAWIVMPDDPLPVASPVNAS